MTLTTHSHPAARRDRRMIARALLLPTLLLSLLGLAGQIAAPATAHAKAAETDLTPLQGKYGSLAKGKETRAPRAPEALRLPRAVQPGAGATRRSERSLERALRGAPKAPSKMTRKAISGELNAEATTQSSGWISGVNSWTYGCKFGINGPETDLMLSSYAMQSTLNDGTLPKIGDRYWGKLYYGITALPCSGVQDVRSEVLLPGNTGFNYDLPNGAHIRCFVKSPSRTEFVEVTDQSETVALPSGGSVTFKWCGKTHSVGARGPFVAQPLLGRGWEYQVVFPLTSYREMKGMATNDKMVGALSGTGLAFAAPSVWTNVLDRAVSIAYPTPSVTGITATAAHTRGYAYNWWKEGKVWAEATKADGGGAIKSPESSLPTDGGYGSTVENDWSGLDPSSDYRWRLMFRQANGSVTTGAWQPFRTAGGKPVNTAPPAVSGTASVGQTLTAGNGSWSGSPSPSFSYAWERCDGAGANCSTISGATSSRYLLTSQDRGRRVRVRVTAGNSSGSATAVSAATAAVTDRPRNTVKPAVSGTAKVGRTLTRTNGTWTGYPAPTYATQWLRCDAAGANCARIADATRSRYVPKAGDVGRRLRVRVTARNSVGSASAVSNATARVAR